MKRALIMAFLTGGGLHAAEPLLPPALRAEFSKVWPKNRAIHLVFHGHNQVEESWRSMIRAAKQQGVAVVVLTPTGDLAADLANPEDPLEVRARLIRRIAVEEGVLLADVFAAWRDELEKGTPQRELMSQGNHPNLRGHTLAAEVVLQVFGVGGER